MNLKFDLGYKLYMHPIGSMVIGTQIMNRSFRSIYRFVSLGRNVPIGSFIESTWLYVDPHCQQGRRTKSVRQVPSNQLTGFHVCEGNISLLGNSHVNMKFLGILCEMSLYGRQSTVLDVQQSKRPFFILWKSDCL